MTDSRKMETPNWLWWLLVILCIAVFIGVNIYVIVQGWA